MDIARNRIFVGLMGGFSLLSAAKASEAISEGEEHDNDDSDHPEHAVLFPAFALTVGLMSFWVITRYARVLPYTAVLFAIGVLMGIGSVLNDTWDDFLNISIRQWSGINSRVLLLVFLPGLIYKDAFGQKVHIFSIAFGQCLIFAFPMVLAGTTLTALIARFFFPYGWSFNLAMAFGAILSATDPVAVAALLEQVGAPPRLKVHIAGEALLNDGAAIVFFEIFAERYLTELGIEGLGHDFGWGDGIVEFFRKSLGAVAVGIFFGCCLLFALYMLNRKFSREENVVQVSATVAFAYLGYYVAEIVLKTSGVLATVVIGVLAKFFGRPILKDSRLLDDFWTLVEHLLNSVLFILGGAVWGAVITKGELTHHFQARDWGYLVALYILLHLIRLCLFVAVYPITSRIGLKTNWRETLFQVYGGLRGAVGIALAIFLDFEVREATGFDPESKYVEQTRKLFGFVGGIAFMTLCINGVTAGPLLKKLHLADSSATREKIVKAYHTRFTTSLIDKMVRLLTQPRFKSVNFALVKHHVPQIAALTRSQLVESVEKHKDTTRPEDYRAPFLDRIVPYLPRESDVHHDLMKSIEESASTPDENVEEFNPELHARKLQHVLRTQARMRRRTKSTMRAMMMGDGVDPLSLQEFRILFISILRSAYEHQIQSGELDDREFLTIALEASLDFAEDAVAKGKTLSDWEYLSLVDNREAARSKFQAKLWVLRTVERFFGKRAHVNANEFLARLRIERSMAFMAAHRWAQRFMQSEFSAENFQLSEAGKTILNESQIQYRKAEHVLHEYSENTVENVVSHKFCLVLLESGIKHTTKIRDYGLLREQEAEHIVEELEKQIHDLLSCDEKEHPGEYSKEKEEESMRDFKEASSFEEEDGLGVMTAL